MSSDHLVIVINELRSEPGADSTFNPHDEDQPRVLHLG